MEENNIVYFITGDIDEVSAIVDPIRTSNRFLSDKPNVEKFDWYPEEDGQLTAEISVSIDTPIDIDELTILTQEYPSLFISLGQRADIEAIISDGLVEAVR